MRRPPYKGNAAGEVNYILADMLSPDVGKVHRQAIKSHRQKNPSFDGFSVGNELP